MLTIVLIDMTEKTWWQGKNVTELKTELKNRNLPTKGKKSDLVSRLESHDLENRLRIDLEEGAIYVYARSLMGTIITVRITANDTITKIKEAIVDKTGGNVNNIVLYYPVIDGSRELYDQHYGEYTYREMKTENISDYQLYNGTTIRFSTQMADRKK